MWPERPFELGDTYAVTAAGTSQLQDEKRQKKKQHPEGTSKKKQTENPTGPD
jgi:hypothetical protein